VSDHPRTARTAALHCRPSASCGFHVGTLYFETAALTGISPAEYARIEHAIQQDGIHIGSEVIALIPGNASRAVDAVAQLQAESNAAEAAKPAAPLEEQLRDLEKRGRQLCASFHQLEGVANCFERQWLIGSIEKVTKMFGRLRLEIRWCRLGMSPCCDTTAV